MVVAVPVTNGRPFRHEARGNLVRLDVSGLGAEIDHHIAEHQPLGHLHRLDSEPAELDAQIGRGVFAIELCDAQRDVLGVDAWVEFAMQDEANHFWYAQPVIAKRQIGGDVGMPIPVATQPSALLVTVWESVPKISAPGKA